MSGDARCGLLLLATLTVVTLTVATLALAPTAARAQALCAARVDTIPSCIAEPDEHTLGAARARYEEGLSHAEGRRWSDALPAFRDAYQSSCNPAALINVATALRNIGRWAEAREAVRVLVARHPDLAAELRALAREITGESAEQVATVRVEGLPVDASPAIRLDGRPCPTVTAETVVLAVDPGERTIDVVAEGHLPFHWTDEVAPAARLAITAELPEQPGEDSTLTWAVGLGAGGAALLALTIALGVFFGSQGPEFDGTAVVLTARF